jgi:hypothetical protein
MSHSPQDWHPPRIRRHREQRGALTGSELDENMTVGRIHQVALGVVAKRLDGRAIHIILDADESPGTKQCLA